MNHIDNLQATAAAKVLCLFCQEHFASRNKLFKHLKECKSSSESIVSARRVLLPSVDRLNMTYCYIYVTGGRHRGRTLASVERFSFETGTWQLCEPLIENRGSHVCCALGSNLYVFGGGGFKSNLATCEVLDMYTGVWSYIASMSTFRHALSLCVLSPDMGEHKIYAIGGWVNGSACSAAVERYEVTSNTWHSCSPLQLGRRLFGTASVKGRIYVFGGHCEDGVWCTPTSECYDPLSDRWEYRQPLPVSGPASAVAVANTFILVFVHGKCVLCYDPEKDSFQRLSSLPLPEWFSFDVSIRGSRVFVTGGAVEGEWTNAMFQYDINADSWERLPDMIRQRRRCAAALAVLDKPPH